MEIFDEKGRIWHYIMPLGNAALLEFILQSTDASCIKNAVYFKKWNMDLSSAKSVSLTCYAIQYSFRICRVFDTWKFYYFLNNLKVFYERCTFKLDIAFARHWHIYSTSINLMMKYWTHFYRCCWNTSQCWYTYNDFRTK